jgi:hypothetical protein
VAGLILVLGELLGRMVIMKNIKFIPIVIIFISMILGCSPLISDNPITARQEYTNKQIMLYAFDQYNTFTTSDVITAEIWNMTENYIEFPNNYNIRIFERTKKGWVEIFEEPVTRLPPGPFTFNPINGSSYIKLIGIFPNLPDINRKYELRIYVSGVMQENDESIEVFAYTDVVLKP